MLRLTKQYLIIEIVIIIRSNKVNIKIIIRI